MAKIYKLLIALFVINCVFVAKADEGFGRITGPSVNEISALAFNPNDLLFAGMWGGGVKRSANNGNTWIDVNNGLGNRYVTSFTFLSKGGKDYTFAGTYGGVYRTENDGNVWESKSTGLEHSKIKCLTTTNDGIVLAGTLGGGVYKSMDNGDSWEQINRGLRHHEINSIISSTDGILIVATNGGGMFRSLDTGKTWIRANASSGRRVNSFGNKLIRGKDNFIFLATNGGGVYESINSGLNWRPIDTTKIPDARITSITINSANEIIAGSRRFGVLRYDDDLYKEWRATNVRNHGINDLTRNTQGLLFAAIPSMGLMRSADGETWTGVSLSERTYSFQLHANRNGEVWAAAKSAGLFKSTDYGETWSTRGFADQQILGFQYTTNRIFAMTLNHLYASTDDGNTWTQLTPNATNRANSAFLVANNGNIFLSVAIIPDPPGAPELRVEIAPAVGQNFAISGLSSNNQVAKFTQTSNGDIWAYADREGLYKKTETGVVWELIGANLFNNKMVSEIASFNNNLYVAVQDTGMYITTNQGVSWDFTNYGLVPPQGVIYYPTVNTIAFENANRFYVGLAEGMGERFTSDGGETWEHINLSHNGSLCKKISIAPDGDIYIASTSIQVKLDTRNVAQPSLQSPSNQARGLSLRPSFSWNPAKNAELYEFQIAQDEGFSNAIDELVFKGTEHEFAGVDLMNNTNYYWRVRSKNFGTYSNWSQRVFRTRLATPKLLLPENNKRGVASTATFTWEQVEGASQYDFQIATNPEFTGQIRNVNNIEDTKVEISDLEFLTTYYWRVRAKDLSSESNWSAPFTFRTKLAPAQLIYPFVDEEDLPTAITFSWRPTAEAKEHYIQISRFEDFEVDIFNGISSTDSTHFFDFLEHKTTYYWRVYAQNDDAQSDYSETRMFTTGLPGVVLSRPLEGAIAVGLSSFLEWEEFEDATDYEIQISENRTMNPLYEENGNTGNNPLYQPKSLKPYSVYYWRVRAKVGDQLSNWSETRSFKTKIANPEPLTPANLSEGVRSDLLKITWSAPKGANTYHVQVSKDPNFNETQYANSSRPVNDFDMFDLEKNTLYNWRVTAQAIDDTSSWSEVFNFRTELDGSSVFYNRSEGISLYPVPANSLLNIELDSDIFNANSSNGINLQIIEQTGATVYTQQFNSNSLKIDTRNFANGSYFAIITNSDGKSYIKELLIQR